MTTGTTTATATPGAFVCCTWPPSRARWTPSSYCYLQGRQWTPKISMAGPLSCMPLGTRLTGRPLRGHWLPRGRNRTRKTTAAGLVSTKGVLRPRIFQRRKLGTQPPFRWGRQKQQLKNLPSMRPLAEHPLCGCGISRKYQQSDRGFHACLPLKMVLLDTHVV